MECLKLLAANGAFLNQALDVPYYETKIFCGATSLNLALNDEIRTFLTDQKVVLGERTGYSLFLETSGHDEVAV